MILVLSPPLWGDARSSRRVLRCRLRWRCSLRGCSRDSAVLRLSRERSVRWIRWFACLGWWIPRFLQLDRCCSIWISRWWLAWSKSLGLRSTRVRGSKCSRVGPARGSSTPRSSVKFIRRLTSFSSDSMRAKRAQPQGSECSKNPKSLMACPSLLLRRCTCIRLRILLVAFVNDSYASSRDMSSRWVPDSCTRLPSRLRSSSLHVPRYRIRITRNDSPSSIVSLCC